MENAAEVCENGEGFVLYLEIKARALWNVWLKAAKADTLETTMVLLTACWSRAVLTTLFSTGRVRG